MSNNADQDTSKVDRQYPGTPAPVPRYGSFIEGSDGQREQMRVALYRAKTHRLQRKTGLLRPPHGG